MYVDPTLKKYLEDQVDREMRVLLSVSNDVDESIKALKSIGIHADLVGDVQFGLIGASITRNQLDLLGELPSIISVEPETDVELFGEAQTEGVSFEESLDVYTDILKEEE